jgi:hypothetical protein
MSSSDENVETSTANDLLRTRLEANRQKFIESGIYLATLDDSFLEHVTWKRVGRGDQLVTTDTTDVINKTDSIKDDIHNTDTTNDNTSSLEQAVFSVVVQIRQDDCWLTPCGRWKGPNRVTKKFEDLKLSFQGERPHHEVFMDDFTTSIMNIGKLLDLPMMTTESDPTAIRRGFLIQSRTNDSSLLKFRHAVFEVSNIQLTHIFNSNVN